MAHEASAQEGDTAVSIAINITKLIVHIIQNSY